MGGAGAGANSKSRVTNRKIEDGKLVRVLEYLSADFRRLTQIIF
jgi:hypothetical protein